MALRRLIGSFLEAIVALSPLLATLTRQIAVSPLLAHTSLTTPRGGIKSTMKYYDKPEESTAEQGEHL